MVGREAEFRVHRGVEGVRMGVRDIGKGLCGEEKWKAGGS